MRLYSELFSIDELDIRNYISFPANAKLNNFEFNKPLFIHYLKINDGRTIEGFKMSRDFNKNSAINITSLPTFSSFLYHKEIDASIISHMLIPILFDNGITNMENIDLKRVVNGINQAKIVFKPSRSKEYNSIFESTIDDYRIAGFIGDNCMNEINISEYENKQAIKKLRRIYGYGIIGSIDYYVKGNIDK